MPQETNLNVSPYFDDFNEDKSFNRVLFKPATPVQARELTQLQTILQNQIERFGQHFFKEGSQVIPGQLAYDPEYNAVELTESFLGIKLTEYVDQLVGKTIRGQQSGVEARVVNFLTQTQSDRGNNTLYVKYITSGDDFQTATFLDGENLIATTDIEYGNTRIVANNPFAACIPSGATSIGSAAAIEEGVYFIRGFFVKVSPSTVILDQYDNNPTARVGLFIEENLVTAYTDETLFDNAGGFSNFAAPGADRLQIKTTLIKKDIDEFNDENFVELLRLDEGELEKFVTKTDYNVLEDTLARRTFDTNGDYYVKPFTVSVKDSLNNRQGNDGIYYSNQKTDQGNDPSNDLMTYQISPGKAYVKGFEIEKITTTLLDVEKPRTTRTEENQQLTLNSVQSVFVNNVYGSPRIGFGTDTTVSLRTKRIATGGTASGTEVGTAKVYDYKLVNSEYEDDTTRYEVFIYDVNTHVTLTVNTAQTLTTPVHIKGARSGATGFLKSNVSSSQSLTLTQTNGIFIKDEPLILNGVEESVSVTSVREYGLGDVHSFHQNVGVNNFTADLELNEIFRIAPPGTQFTITSGGVITGTGTRFATGISTGDIVAYQKSGDSDPTFNEVSALSADGSTVTVIATPQTISGICDKDLPGTTIQVSDFGIIKAGIQGGTESALFTPLPKRYISSLNIDSSEIEIRKQYTLNISSSRGTVTVEDPDLFFLPFDEERYNLAYSDGVIEPLTDAKVQFNSDFKTVTLRGLSKVSNTDAVLVATLKKINVASKPKTLTRCASVTIDRSKYDTSGSTGTSFNNGLTYNTVFGTRVEDEDICLNVPDVLRVHAVFESSTTAAPTLPSITLINRSADLTETLQGEFVLGSESGAYARVVNRTATSVDIVYMNELTFDVEEAVVFQSSGISGEVSVVVEGDTNIGENFEFDNGQRFEYYDYGRITRIDDAPEPKKQLTIVYDHYIVDSGSGGDFGTVNSYPSDAYDRDLPMILGRAAADFIDVRPRVKNYSPASDTDSPFEPDFRDFLGTGNSPANILPSEDPLTIDYSYYLGRTDLLTLSPDGYFQIRKGAPSEDPVAPDNASGAFLVGTLFHAPYIRLASEESKAVLSSHKRYTMADIGRLESRVQNIEFYTQLSLLETETENLNIKDADTGLDRFKSGFFVDNFKSHGSHDIANKLFRASIDKKLGELRPSHYTTAYDLLIGSEQIVGIGTTANPNADLTQVADLQDNSLQRTGDCITLKYTEKKFIEQKFATRTENVNPFAVINWVGIIQLNPASDTWIDEKHLKPKKITEEGDYNTFMDLLNINPNTGLSPIDWGAWEETWTGSKSTTQELSSKTVTSGKKEGSWSKGFTNGGELLPPIHAGKISRTRKVTITEKTTKKFQTVTTTKTGYARSGIQYSIQEKWDTQSLGTKLVGSDIIPYMRSRNIEFLSYRIKPSTRFYPFFNGVEVAKYTTPKLIEVEMKEGVFQVGETVKGTMPKKEQSADFTNAEITFRVAAANHKYGPYDKPEIVYDVNPYSRSVGLSSTYSATSSVLNVDTGSLQLEVLGEFNGYIAKKMKLVGQTSGARAVVKDRRLITDEKGSLLGSFFVPDTDDSLTAPQFETGTGTFRLSSSAVNSKDPVDNPSTAEENFYAEGTLNKYQETILSTRNGTVTKQNFTDSTVKTGQTVKTFQTESFDKKTKFQNQWYDPLAESFEIIDDNGVFVTSCDVFFSTKDAAIPVTCQIRTMQTGLPTQTIVPFGEVVYEPSQVKLSQNGSVATKFKFPSPVYLEPGEYCIVLLSASNDYNVFISVMEEEDITTKDLPESERVIISQQPYMGSLFKSQNGSTWTPAQFEDLKFTLFKAQFVDTPGTLKLYNPEIGADKKSGKLARNPLVFLDNRVRVGLGSTVATRDFSQGSRLTQVGNTNAEGNIVKSLGSIKINTSATEAGGITTNSVGTGATPSSGNLTYTGIALTTITGDGTGATANITINSGAVGVVTVTNGGNGYAVGDVVGCNLGNTGKNLRFNVGIISATNAFILEKVQGEFTTSAELMTINAVGVASTLPGSQPTTISNTSPERDGLHVKVRHRNHGMHASNNRVIIDGAVGVTSTTDVSETYTSGSTSDLKVASVGLFASFENVGVSTTNPGYVKIGREILSYTGTNPGTTPQRLTGITRGIDNTVAEQHDVGDKVRKYEAYGVSLRRINTTHRLAQVSNNVRNDLDYYHIKIDTTSTGIGTVRDGTNSFPELRIAESGLTGGAKVKATQNTQFEAITPNIEYMSPRDTTLDARVRTVSATSVDGTEVSFLDQGFQDVEINGTTYFDTPRLVASKVNEDQNLTSLPGSKSLTMELVLKTEDTNVSPVIDTDRISVVTTTNRVNRPVTNYIDDNRVTDKSDRDPNQAVYISKRVDLENPASFLQVKLAGHQPPGSDFRVLYKLFRPDTIDEEQPYELFPGFANLTDTTGDGFGDRVKDPRDNDGLPDKKVPLAKEADDFRDYQYTAKDLKNFTGFQIKIIMTSTDQAKVPKIRDLRGIAFA